MSGGEKIMIWVMVLELLNLIKILVLILFMSKGWWDQPHHVEKPIPVQLGFPFKCWSIIWSHKVVAFQTIMKSSKQIYRTKIWKIRPTVSVLLSQPNQKKFIELKSENKN